LSNSGAILLRENVGCSPFAEAGSVFNPNSAVGYREGRSKPFVGKPSAEPHLSAWRILFAIFLIIVRWEMVEKGELSTGYPQISG
jgi:hypothetical protein